MAPLVVERNTASAGPQSLRELCRRVARMLGDPREARALLAGVLDMAPLEVSVHGERIVDSDVVSRIDDAASRRISGEPLAYCVGSVGFRELTLHVDRRVLIPRPETEVLVDEVLRISRQSPGGTAVDVGTGSGAIALSLAREGSFDTVIATDLSADALEVARSNHERLGGDHCPVEFRHGDGLAPMVGIRARVLVSNPPYIAYEEAAQLPASVREFEPHMALFAADGGMAMYDRLLVEAPEHLEPGGWLVLEVDATRAMKTAETAERTGRFGEVGLVRDLSGRLRVLVARLAG